VVDSEVRVFNQHGEVVMTYTAKRLLAGRDPVSAAPVGTFP
jgi:hypothetical protein